MGPRHSCNDRHLRANTGHGGAKEAAHMRSIIRVTRLARRLVRRCRQCVGATERPCLRDRPLVAGSVRTGPDRHARAVRRPAGRTHPRRQQRHRPGGRFPRSLGGRPVLRRTRPPRHGARARLRGDRALLRPLQPAARRQPRRRKVPPRNGHAARRGSVLALRSALGRTGRRAVHPAAVLESQRRQPGVRSRRLPLRRSGRRWVGRKIRGIGRRTRGCCLERCCA